MRQSVCIRMQATPLISAAALAAFAVVGSANLAIAQSGPGNAAQPNTTIPEKQDRPSSPAADVTKKDGVIEPKHDVDPQMTKIPPAPTGDENVIPPKGTTGGAQPK
jgi:hypothetical protein